MKLYYSPGVCSLSPHIILREAGLEFDLEKVDLATGKTETGKSVGDVNPKGYVPVLELDDGEALTEGAAIVQYIADALAPGKNLAPANGTIARIAKPGCIRGPRGAAPGRSGSPQGRGPGVTSISRD